MEPIYAPGERSHERRLEAQREGVEVAEQVLAKISELAGAA